MLGTIPFKGQVLNQHRGVLVRARPRDLAPNHVISVPDPTVMVARECKLAAGRVRHARVPDRRDVDVDLVRRTSAARARSAATTLPDGMKKNQRLREGDPHAVDEGREGRSRRSVSRAELLAMGLLSAEDFDTAAR